VRLTTAMMWICACGGWRALRSYFGHTKLDAVSDSLSTLTQANWSVLHDIMTGRCRQALPDRVSVGRQMMANPAPPRDTLKQ